MPNYQNGKIYKLVSPGGLTYIGSTCQSLAVRKAGHKGSFKANKRTTSEKLFEEDQDNVDIVLIEKYPCKDKEELHRRERYWVEQTVCVNKCIPGRTSKEFYQDHKEERKEYYEKYRKDNKDILLKKDREYYSINKDIIAVKHSTKVMCDCGLFYTIGHKSRHMKTAKHLKLVEK